MSTSAPRAGEKIKAVRIDEDLVTVDLFDGRTVSVPVAWYPRFASRFSAGAAELGALRSWFRHPLAGPG